MFVINVLLTRLLSPHDMGTYFLAFSVMMVGTTAGVLGLNQAVIRLVAESAALDQPGRTRRVIHVVLVLGALGASGTSLAYLLFGSTLGRHLFHAPTLVAINGLVAAWIAAMILQMLLAETFRGFSDIRLATVFGGVFANVLLALCLTLLWLGKGQTTLSTVVLLALCTVAISVLMAAWMLHRKMALLLTKNTPDRVGYGEVLRMAWPMLVVSFSLYALSQADLWVVGAFRPQDEVALYGAAVRMVLFVPMALLIINAVVQPLIAQMYAQDRKQELERALRGMATLAVIPAFCLMAGYMLLGKPLLGLIFGDYYRGAATVLILLSVGQVVQVWVGSCAHTLLMTGYQAALMKITVINGVVTIVAELGAASYFGVLGVAMAGSVGLISQSILIWLETKRKTGIWTHPELTGFANLLRTVRERL